MRYRLGSPWVCAAVALLVLAGAITARAQAEWTVTDLGTLGGLFGDAEAINDAGHVVGESSLSGDHAFLWTPAGGMIHLGTLGGPSSRAHRHQQRGAGGRRRGPGFL